MIFRGLGFSGKNYLMDLYGTATAGYSLRRLRRNYRGPAIKVRRSSDNALKDIYFKGENLDTQELLNFVGTSGSDDGFVQTWYDQAGSNDATQTTAANQPKIVSAGALVTENGKVALDFDGSNDGLFTSAFAFSASSVSAFVVYKNGSTSGQKNIFRQRANGIFGTQNGYIFEMGLTTSTTQYGGNTAIDDGVGAISASASGQGTQDLNQHLESLIYKSDEILAYQDGNLNETLNNTSGTTPIGSISMTQSLWIGRNFGSNDREYDGLLQELIIYNSDKSAQRTDIEGNINGHYNIYTP